jgi:hypothetical protein
MKPVRKQSGTSKNSSLRGSASGRSEPPVTNDSAAELAKPDEGAEFLLDAADGDAESSIELSPHRAPETRRGNPSSSRMTRRSKRKQA